ncbi:hypothetical protein NDU88_002761 [Pleurodeles waltl]|uniref:Uncharacterized protein n=1 Tax=Pleurodeles waltl TaxID=8319 RepID=A0AAV7T2U1_PLEWA|nr:hypothetical protein NDU88_002761 [Pleurodeles waltl]
MAGLGRTAQCPCLCWHFLDRPRCVSGFKYYVGQSPHQREPGQLKGQASRWGEEKAIVRGEDGTTMTEEGDREEDEDGIETPDRSGRPRDLTGPSAPLECGRGEKTRTAAVPIGDEESWLRGAEHYYPPRFRRSVAESGTWTWPGQG